ncbi:hypothetical protein BH11BAC7_BH11BAC7_28180 [soil metagenome]
MNNCNYSCFLRYCNRMRNPAASQFISSVLICLFSSAAVAQNLVPNPGFEEYKKIPITFCRTAKEFNATVTDWTMPNEATSDYFHAKCKASASTIKNNFAGFQQAKEGEAYAGMYCVLDKGISYSEYLQTKLIQPLKAGQKYTIQFYVSLSEASEFAIDRLGVLFVKKQIKQENMFPLNYIPTVESADTVFYDDKTGWRQVRMSFIANGGERYMIIGNFHGTRTRLKTVPVNKKRFYKENGCYYYVDDICLAEEDAQGICICPIQPEDTFVIKLPSVDSIPVIKITIGTPMVLNFEFFDTDKSILKPESFPSLDSLVFFLSEEKKYFITITGHTDNSGDEIKNQKLSQDRAKAVTDYLILKGIHPDRISTEGKGSEIPVADNESPEGRAKNRRVEYTLKQ